MVVAVGGAVVADGPKSEVLTRDLLGDVYGTDLCLTEIEGHYFAYPRLPT